MFVSIAVWLECGTTQKHSRFGKEHDSRLRDGKNMMARSRKASAAFMRFILSVVVGDIKCFSGRAFGDYNQNGFVGFAWEIKLFDR